MYCKNYRFAAWLLPLAVVLFLATGCNQADPPAGGDVTEAGGDAGDAHTAAHDDHSGWWCAPHGVPEEECTQCSATAAATAKENGDWCEEHNRAESQCFICHPENAETFAALYRAKYGEDPPALPE